MKRLNKNNCLSFNSSVFEYVVPLIKKVIRSVKNKYGNISETIKINGKEERFDSLSEYVRYQFLLLKQYEGQITDLKRQVTFKFGLKRSYRADFTYYRNNELVVEDVKSPKLLFGKKFKENVNLMKLIHDIDIKVVSPLRLYKW